MQQTSAILFSFFLSLFFSSSCTNKPSHKETLAYYSNLMRQTSKMHEETNSFMINSVEIEQSLMSSLMKSSLNNSHNPTNLSLIDSFKKLYSHLNITLDSIVKNLDSIIEIDKHINLKSKAIAYANQTLQFYEKSFQYTLKTLDESELTSDQSNEEKLSLNLAKQDLDVSKSTFLSSAQKFETTYKITQEELKKYGL